MKNRKGFGQLIITIMFIYSAILCHFHASELKVNGDTIEVKQQKTTLEESDMEELIDEYQNVPYDYDDTKH